MKIKCKNKRIVKGEIKILFLILFYLSINILFYMISLYNRYNLSLIYPRWATEINPEETVKWANIISTMNITSFAGGVILLYLYKKLYSRTFECTNYLMSYFVNLTEESLIFITSFLIGYEIVLISSTCGVVPVTYTALIMKNIFKIILTINLVIFIFTNLFEFFCLIQKFNTTEEK